MYIKGKRKQAEDMVSGDTASLSSVGGGDSCYLHFKTTEFPAEGSSRAAVTLVLGLFSSQSSSFVVTILAPAGEATEQMACIFVFILVPAASCPVRCFLLGLLSSRCLCLQLGLRCLGVFLLMFCKCFYYIHFVCLCV